MKSPVGLVLVMYATYKPFVVKISNSLTGTVVSRKPDIPSSLGDGRETLKTFLVCIIRN